MAFRHSARYRPRHSASAPFICDKAYASKANREAAEGARHRSGHSVQVSTNGGQTSFLSPRPCMLRALASNRVSDGSSASNAVAHSCEKTARNFRSIVSFAAGLCLIKFVHTA